MPLSSLNLACVLLLLVLVMHHAALSRADVNLTDVAESLGIPLQLDLVGSPVLLTSKMSPKLNYYAATQILGGIFNHTYEKRSSSSSSSSSSFQFSHLFVS